MLTPLLEWRVEVFNDPTEGSLDCKQIIGKKKPRGYGACRSMTASATSDEIIRVFESTLDDPTDAVVLGFVEFLDILDFHE